VKEPIIMGREKNKRRRLRCFQEKKSYWFTEVITDRTCLVKLMHPSTASTPYCLFPWSSTCFVLLASKGIRTCFCIVSFVSFRLHLSSPRDLLPHPWKSRPLPLTVRFLSEITNSKKGLIIIRIRIVIIIIKSTSKWEKLKKVNCSFQSFSNNKQIHLSITEDIHTIIREIKKKIHNSLNESSI